MKFGSLIDPPRTTWFILLMIDADVIVTFWNFIYRNKNIREIIKKTKTVSIYRKNEMSKMKTKSIQFKAIL